MSLSRIKKNYPSKRALDPTKLSHLKSKGRVRTKRLSVTHIVWTVVNISEKMNFLLLRNDGANDIKIRFGQAVPTQYYTLVSGQTLPTPIEIKDNVTIRVRSVTAGSTLEFILWG